MIRDEAGRSIKPTASCEAVSGVDEEEVNRQLEIGRDLGPWTPFNTCQMVENNILNNAAYRPGTPTPSVAPQDATKVNWGR